MRATKKLIISGVAAVVLTAGGGVASAAAGGGDHDETPITGDALATAGAAALAWTGGGEVTDSEVGDEDSYYEVEVTSSDGSAVDVQLDASFLVVGSAGDLKEDGDG